MRDGLAVVSKDGKLDVSWQADCRDAARLWVNPMHMSLRVAGKTTKQILYTQFLDSLDAALEGSTGQQVRVDSINSFWGCKEQPVSE